jgi:hypothetical protein
MLLPIQKSYSVIRPAKLFSVALGFSLVALSHSASAQTTLFYDNFADLDFNNASGIGGPLNTLAVNSATVSASSGYFFGSNPVNGASRFAFGTTIGADTTLPGVTTRYQFTGVSFSADPNSHSSGNTTRFALGVQSGTSAHDFSGSLPGFSIEIMNDNLALGGTANNYWDGTSAFFYTDNSGHTTELANWTFPTLNWQNGTTANYTPTLNLEIDLTATTWAFNITGDSSPIAFSGNDATSGITDDVTSGAAYEYSQTENVGIDTKINRITISTVPEPSTLALFGASLGLLPLIFRRRK